jgi:hypothetical protein
MGQNESIYALSETQAVAKLKIGSCDAQMTTRALIAKYNVTSRWTQNEAQVGKMELKEANIYPTVPSMATF